MNWHKATERKPKQGDRVLLKIRWENCPVVGYWGEGRFEACCVNHEVECSGFCLGGMVTCNFQSNEVSHWAEIENVPEDKWEVEF